MRHLICQMAGRSISFFGLFLMSLFIGDAAQAQQQKIVLQNIHLQQGERVEGLEFSIKAGSFVGFDPIPIGWYLIIDNDPSQQTSVKGDARVGTAALELGDLLKLKILARKVEFGNLKFSISGTLTVTKTFEHERRIPLHPENFKISEIREIRGKFGASLLNHHFAHTSPPPAPPNIKLF